MGFIRGALVTVFAIVLLISLFVMNVSLTLSWSLEYNTLKPVLGDSVKELIGDYTNLENAIDRTIPLMQIYCLNNTEFVFNEEGHTFVIPCETINQGSSAIIDYGIDYLIRSVYNQEYDCEFWQCVKETNSPLVLISKKAHDYWNSKFYIFMLTSLALLALMFFVSKHKNSVFILWGILIVLSSLPFMKLNWAVSFVPEGFGNILLSFFTRAYNVFLIMFIIGLFLVGLGVAFHFFKVGIKISNLFKKDSEEASKEDIKTIIKEEISKSKKPKK